MEKIIQTVFTLSAIAIMIGFSIRVIIMEIKKHNRNNKFKSA